MVDIPALLIIQSMNIGISTEHAEPPSETAGGGERERGRGGEGETRDSILDPRSSILHSRPLWHLSPAGALLVLVAATGLLLASHRPLWHTDLWGHLAYGRLIWESGEIPETAPLMPLARGVEFIDTAWLSQILEYLTIREFGVAGLQTLAGLCVALTGGLLMAVGWRKTGSLIWTLIGAAAWLWLEWKQFFAGGDLSLLIRPQLAGLLAFVMTLAIVVGGPRWWHWAVVPVLFAAWANLHGSFPVGLALFGIFAIGRGGDLLRRTDRFGVILLDWTFWRFVLLGEIAAAAVLLNPYGLRLYAEVLLFSGNPNLAALVEWEPLTLHMAQGQAAAGVTLVLLFLYRMTPRRIQTAEVLALLILGGMTLWTSRMIVWWAPVAAWCLMMHGAAVWGGGAKARKRAGASTLPWWRGGVTRANPLWSLTGLAMIAGAIVLTPFGAEQFRGATVPFEDAVSSRTPLGAARHLSENPPAGLIFNSMEFGDFLMWTNPGMPVFVGSHVHLVPRDVWVAYLETVRGQSDWDTVLDRYGVNTIVLDRARHQPLIDRIAENEDWRRSYQDFNSAVFRRVGSGAMVGGEE